MPQSSSDLHACARQRLRSRAGFAPRASLPPRAAHWHACPCCAYVRMRSTFLRRARVPGVGEERHEPVDEGVDAELEGEDQREGQVDLRTARRRERVPRERGRGRAVNARGCMRACAGDGD